MKKNTIFDNQVRLIASGGVLLLILTGNACSGGVRAISESNSEQIARIEKIDEKNTDLELSTPHLIEPEFDIEQHRQEQAVETGQDRRVQRFDREEEPVLSLEEEALGLYRRLHIELDESGRSSLIIELFEDTRLVFRKLGYELANKDLSSSTELDTEVGESAIRMLRDENPQIRVLAALLSLRMVPPDTMIAFTKSLALEDTPLAAAPLLRGISRWPNTEAVEDVLRWFVRDDSPLVSATNAAWALQQAGYMSEEDQTVVITHLRKLDIGVLSESSMKLIALLGDASDLETLVGVLLVDDIDQRNWAASALVETPRAVEPVVQAAEENEQLFVAASDALIRHRNTPEGLRRLVALPYSDERVRLVAIERMGSVLENDRLAEAVRLADINDDLAALLLNRLLNGNVEVTPRVAKGILWYAAIELAGARPNRALEASIALDNVSLDPGERQSADSIKVQSLILLGRLDDAYASGSDVVLWFDVFRFVSEPELSSRIALYINDKFADGFSNEQQEILDSYIIESSDEAEHSVGDELEDD